MDALFHFAAAPLESSNRVRILAEAVHGETGVEMERLEALLGLLTLLMRVVLVADDLEGFSTDETAALRLAAFLGSLRQSVERLDVILSLNQDIWESAFMPRLSGGLADRLSEVVVELEPLTEAEMEALLDSRVPGLGRRVLDRIDRVAAGSHARGLIRAAGLAWLKASAMDTSQSPASAGLVVPAAVAAVVTPPPEPIATPEPVAPEMVTVAQQVEPEKVVETTPISESSPFSFAAPAAVEPAVEWPVPVFSPPVAEIAVEPMSEVSPVESPFLATPELETGPPIQAPANPQWQESPPVFVPQESVEAPPNSWNPPAQAIEPPPEPPVFHPQVDSPFQVAVRQTEPEPQTTSFESAGWQNEPAAEPAYVAKPIEDFIVPVQDFHPLDRPFQNSPQPWAPEPTPFNPGEWQEPASTPPQQGIFVAPPRYEAPVEPSFQPASAPLIPEPPQNFPVSEPYSTFVNEPSPVFLPNPEPVSNPALPPAEVSPSPTIADTDRVDDLLRQFRERYGRGSL